MCMRRVQPGIWEMRDQLICSCVFVCFLLSGIRRCLKVQEFPLELDILRIQSSPQNFDCKKPSAVTQIWQWGTVRDSAWGPLVHMNDYIKKLTKSSNQ